MLYKAKNPSNIWKTQGWWIPAGRLDAGETFQEAVIREAKEESGMDVQIEGILAVEYSAEHSKHRVFFFCSPKDPNQIPKMLPDYGWFISKKKIL